MPVIKLSRPVEHDGRIVSEIEVDEPCLGSIERFEEVKAAGGTELSATIALLAAETGLPADAIRKIRSKDFVRVSEALGDFFGEGTPGPNGEA